MICPGSPGGGDGNPIADGISVAPPALGGEGRSAPRVQGLTPPGYSPPPLRGFRMLSRASASVMDEVAPIVNNFALRERGEPHLWGRAG